MKIYLQAQKYRTNACPVLLPFFYRKNTGLSG